MTHNTPHNTSSNTSQNTATPPTVSLKRLPHAHDIELPAYATLQSAGMDLRAAVPVDNPLLLYPGQRTLIPTGLCIALPPGFEAQVRPRSGLALHHGITVLNAPGTIDSDYRGELKILLINHGPEPFLIQRHERIAQLVVARHEQIRWHETTSLDTTTRGSRGFGHTGI